MDNKIFVGDNLDVLNSNLMDDFVNKVSLVYIDPPYNNGSKFSYDNFLSESIAIKKTSLDTISSFANRLINSSMVAPQ